jgi:hypothetical protein
VRNSANEILAAGLPRKFRGAPPRGDRFIEVTGRYRGEELAIAKRVLATRSQREIFGGSFPQSFAGNGKRSGVLAAFYVSGCEPVQR